MNLFTMDLSTTEKMLEVHNEIVASTKMFICKFPSSEEFAIYLSRKSKLITDNVLIAEVESPTILWLTANIFFSLGDRGKGYMFYPSGSFRNEVFPACEM